jgi:transcriptional regulator with XRE-family HTH domain
MPTPNPKDQKAIEMLGRNVRTFRKLKGLTIIQLAGKCEVEYTTISKIERGIVNTTVSMITIIAKALEITPSKLLEE